MKCPSAASLRWFVFFFAATLFSMPATADEVILVSRQASLVQMQVDDLIAGLSGAQGVKNVQILRIKYPVHGALTKGNDVLTYRPEAGFREAGIDSFMVDFGWSHGHKDVVIGTARVFLVADLKLISEHFDLGRNEPASFTERDPADLLDVVLDPVTGEPTIYVNPAPPGAYIWFAHNSDQEPDSGGTTVFELDDGGEGNGLVVSRISGTLDPMFEIALKGGNVVARARDGNGTWHETASAPLQPGSRIEYTWWLAESEDASDGGLFLVVDGQHVDTLLGIDNFALRGADTQVQFGAWTPLNVDAGPIVITKIETWRSPRPPVYVPLLATSAEDDGLDLWSFIERAALVHHSPDAAASGRYGIRVTVPTFGSTAGVTSDAPDSETRFRQRFALDASALSSGSHVAVAVANRSFGGTGFQIEVRSRAGILEVRVATGSEADPELSTNWVELPSTTTTVELLWWQIELAQAGSGGVMLWLDGLPAGSMSLTNSGQRIDSFFLGAIDLNGISAGTLDFDDIVVWR